MKRLVDKKSIMLKNLIVNRIKTMRIDNKHVKSDVEFTSVRFYRWDDGSGYPLVVELDIKCHNTFFNRFPTRSSWVGEWSFGRTLRVKNKFFRYRVTEEFKKMFSYFGVERWDYVEIKKIVWVPTVHCYNTWVPTLHHYNSHPTASQDI